MKEKLYIRNEDLDALLSSKPNESGLLVLYRPDDGKEICSLGKVVLKEGHKQPGYYDDLDNTTTLNIMVNPNICVAFYKRVDDEKGKDNNMVYSLELERQINRERMIGDEHYEMFKDYYNKIKELFATVYNDELTFIAPERKDGCTIAKTKDFEKAENNRILAYKSEDLRRIIRSFDL